MQTKELRIIAEQLKQGNSPVMMFPIPGQQESVKRLFRKHPRLIILGGGYVAQSLCRFAAMLEFTVVVVDDRPSFANIRLFSAASSVICNSFLQALNELNTSSADYVAVVTRGHRQDADCLRHILASDRPMPEYVGLIGSKRRVGLLMEMLKEEGVDESRLSMVHTPIGLDIHAVTPDEIAVSIVAEMIQEKNMPGKMGNDILEQSNTDPAVVRAFETLDELVLALVLSRTGSAPVKAGAVMVVDAAGNTYGTIGGGYGEYSILQKALEQLKQKEDCTIEVDMTKEALDDEGMICGGKMRVVLYYFSE